MFGEKDVVKVEYNVLHKYASKLSGFPVDSHKWLTVLVCKVKGKSCNFEANLYGSLYSTFKLSRPI